MMDEELKKNIDEKNEEMLKKVRNIKILSLGFTKDDHNREKYIEAEKNATFDAVLDELEALKNETTYDHINVEELLSFINKYNELLNNVQNVTLQDAYFNRRIGSVEFKASFDNVRASFSFVEGYMVTQREIADSELLLERYDSLRKKANHKMSLINLGRKDNGEVLSELDLDYRDAAEKELEEVEKLYKNEKIAYEERIKRLETLKESLSNLDVNELCNEMFSELNKLSASYRTLEMASPELRDELGAAIDATRDALVGFRTNIIMPSKKVEDLAKSIGLKKVSVSKRELEQTIEAKKKELEELKNELNKFEEQKLESKIEEPIVEPIQTVDPIVEPIQPTEPTVEPEIKDLYDLAKEIQRLNPDVKMSYENGTLTVENVDDLSTLKLPDGFNYDEILGINNKVDDLTPYLGLPTSKKVHTLDTEPTPVKEETNTEELEEPKKEGKRYKVKKTRKAILAPYVYSTLAYGCLGAICAMGASVGMAPVLPVALVGAGIGAIGQKIYNSMAASGLVDKEHAKERETDETFQEKTWTMASLSGIASAVKKKSKELFDILRGNRKKEEPHKEEPALEENFDKRLDENLEEEKLEEIPKTNEEKEESMDEFRSWVKEALGEPGELYNLDEERSSGGR